MIGSKIKTTLPHAALWLLPPFLYGVVALPLLMTWFGDPAPGYVPSLATRILGTAAALFQCLSPLAYIAYYFFAVIRFVDLYFPLPAIARFMIILCLLVLPFAIAAVGVYAVILAMSF